MRTLAAYAAFVVALLLSLPARAETPPPQRLTIDDAIAVAGAKNPELAMSAMSIAAQKKQLESTKGLRLPALILKSNLMVWNAELAFQLPSTYGFAEWPSTYPTQPPMIVPMGLEEMTVRGRITSSTTLTAMQPLTLLLIYNEMVKINRAGLAASHADHSAAKLGVGSGIAQAYLMTLQIKAASDIGNASVAQVEAQLERARILQAGDVLEKVDVMRLEAALANVRQQAAAAASGAIQAERQLVHIMGLPATARVEVIDEFATAPTPPPWAEAEVIDLVRRRRPELEAARQRSAQAAAGRELARWKLAPNILALASFQHDEGGGVFAIKNSWFVGLTMEWTLWDWGHKWHALDEAKIKQQQALLAAGRLEDQLILEARNYALTARTAFETIAVAEAGLAAAEEAFRLQTIRYAEGAATTTDLLDAETEVTRARLGYVSARYSYFLALVTLAQSIGEKPSSALFGSK